MRMSSDAMRGRPSSSMVVTRRSSRGWKELRMQRTRTPICDGMTRVAEGIDGSAGLTWSTERSCGQAFGFSGRAPPRRAGLLSLPSTVYAPVHTRYLRLTLAPAISRLPALALIDHQDVVLRDLGLRARPAIDLRPDDRARRRRIRGALVGGDR